MRVVFALVIALLLILVCLERSYAAHRRIVASLTDRVAVRLNREVAIAHARDIVAYARLRLFDHRVEAGRRIGFLHQVRAALAAVYVQVVSRRDALAFLDDASGRHRVDRQLQIAPFNRVLDRDRRAPRFVIHHHPFILLFAMVYPIHDAAESYVAIGTTDDQRFSAIKPKLTFAVNGTGRLFIVPRRFAPQQAPDAPLDLFTAELPHAIAAHLA